MSSPAVVKPPASRHKATNKYVGERKRQLRHGYGVYNYDNRFFQYEGHWENGLKNGHGKLVLADGGYYEGTFVNGEIEGHGYRVFGVSGATYSGQFHNGEMHGQGLFRRPSGEQYEGTWAHGRREGAGILTDREGGVYEGGFHDNKRHGEGVQVYSNGDQYDGDWVGGKRHGQGLLRCSNGTIYDGQWRGDVYHGEGYISHCSGVMYRGMWTNGRPTLEPVKLRLGGGVTRITVEQGKMFSLEFECVNEEDEVVHQESGRCFKATAAVRKTLKKQKSSWNKSRLSLSPLPSKSTEILQSFPTPFGYPAYPYELLQVPQPNVDTPPTSTRESADHTSDPSTNQQSKSESSGKSRPKLVVTFSEIENRSSDPSVPDLYKSTSNENVQQGHVHFKDEHTCSASTTSLDSPTPSIKHLKERTKSFSQGTTLSGPETRSLLLPKILQAEHSSQTKDEKFLESLVSPAHTPTRNGQGLIKDLFLPPPPPPDISHILSPSPSRLSLTLSGQRSPSTPPTLSPRTSSDGTSSLKLSPTQSRKKVVASQMSSMKLGKSDEKLEKLLQPKRDKFCHPGSYVVVISEVTEPPFLELRLPDLFVEVTVVAQKVVPKVDKLFRSKSKLKM